MRRGCWATAAPPPRRRAASVVATVAAEEGAAVAEEARYCCPATLACSGMGAQPSEYLGGVCDLVGRSPATPCARRPSATPTRRPCRHGGGRAVGAPFLGPAIRGLHRGRPPHVGTQDGDAALHLAGGALRPRAWGTRRGARRAAPGGAGGDGIENEVSVTTDTDVADVGCRVTNWSRIES